MQGAAILAYGASTVLVVWGAAHLVPTEAVVESFGAISVDNRRILVMEWVAEGVTHISLGVLVALATAVDGAGDSTTRLIYVVVAGVLVVFAGLTLATGARTPVVWFRVCPVVLGTAAALLVAACLI